jgi:hypothetical protein
MAGLNALQRQDSDSAEMLRIPDYNPSGRKHLTG